jgi:hypothetical protein
VQAEEMLGKGEGGALVAGEHGEAANEIVVRGTVLGILEVISSSSHAA